MAAPGLDDRLAHIEVAIDALERLWQSRTFHDFIADAVLIAASERFLERICEAAKHIPAADRQLHPEIPWDQIRGLGNRLRHGYETIDPRLLWDIIEKDLGLLRVAVTDIRNRSRR